MKILILGATGRTGTLVLEEANRIGYETNCLVRNSKKIAISNQKNGIKIFEGTPEKLKDLEKAYEGCNSIINALNISRRSDFPWSKLRTPKNFLSKIMENILQVKNNQSIERVIVCSAWGVSDTKKDLPNWFSWLIDNSNIGAPYRDHENQEEMLMNSDLPWTIVRPSALTNSKKQQQVIESYKNHPKPNLTISRSSLAGYMVDALEDDSLIHKAPVISGTKMHKVLTQKR